MRAGEPKKIPRHRETFFVKGAVMRNMMKTAAAGAAMMVMTLGAAFAGPMSAPQPGGAPALETGALQAQWGGYGGGYGYCQRLRWKCEHKYELGQEGAGNCQRYREECGGGRARYCEQLRWRCEHKNELGQEGMGNCQRYRQECGGRGGY